MASHHDHNHDQEQQQRKTRELLAESTLAALSLKRPVFVTCMMMLIIIVGYLSFGRLPVNLFPDVSFPVIFIQTYYPGAGPQEVETNVSKVFEDELAGLEGLKVLRTQSLEGLGITILQFTNDVDVADAEQRVRDQFTNIKSKLPKEVKEPLLRRIDPADMPVASFALKTVLPMAKAYDIAKDLVKVRLEQVSGVGQVDLLGARKREIKVQLDQERLKEREISATQVSQRLSLAGLNVPSGKVNLASGEEQLYRTVGEFKSLGDIGKTVVSFIGNEVPVTVADLGTVEDSLEEERSRAFVGGEPAIVLEVRKQTGENTIAIVNSLIKKIDLINTELKTRGLAAELVMVRDGSREIKANVQDVKESIFIGIILTILVVYFFLKNFKSTLITGMALPNSLLGAFILIVLAGFSVNIMTLLALSLSVGLLIDDAIVVRENIFRRREMGEGPVLASLMGTKEVMMAVIATTATVLAVFGPIAFLDGIVGQFFKEFGLTICFAMVISTLDALTIAPMLSTYFAAKISFNHQEQKADSRWLLGLKKFYTSVIEFSLRQPVIVLSVSLLIFIYSLYVVAVHVPKTFLPVADIPEFVVAIELPPGASIEQTAKVAQEVDREVRSHSEVALSQLTVGDTSTKAGAQYATIYVAMVERSKRAVTSIVFKDRLREIFANKFAKYRPVVKDFDPVGGGERPFSLAVIGDQQGKIEEVALRLMTQLNGSGALKDIEWSVKPNRKEVRIVPSDLQAKLLGVSTTQMGMELRNLVEGEKVGVLRENGPEYDIRVRLKEEHRDLLQRFDQSYVPNLNYSLVPLKKVATLERKEVENLILRQDKSRYIYVGADVSADGAGMGGAIDVVKKFFVEEDRLHPGHGVRYEFIGQAENSQELNQNMAMAMILAVIFIFLILASLYESFIIPLTIMLVLPLAMCGAFFALGLTQLSLDIFSMIGCVMLMGVATKNSIILVDYANQLSKQGVELTEAIKEACMKRVRPILMTSIALIAGMLPVAIGMNEASRQRMSMGVAIIGGVITSTLLSLVVIPASYRWMEMVRRWSLAKVRRWFHVDFDVR